MEQKTPQDPDLVARTRRINELIQGICIAILIGACLWSLLLVGTFPWLTACVWGLCSLTAFACLIMLRPRIHDEDTDEPGEGPTGGE